MQLPQDVALKFAWIRLYGDRAIISGHCGLSDDGRIAQPLGKLGADLSIEQGYAAERMTALSVLASLEKAFGDLDQVQCWLRAFGMINAKPTYDRHPAVLEGFSDLIIDLYGRERAEHARSAVGMTSLPFNIAVEVEAECRQ